MTLLDKEGVKRVEKSLKEFDPKQNVIVLKSSARTALEAASSLDCEVGAIVKSLLFKTENTFTLCLVAGDKKASLNKIKNELNIKDASNLYDRTMHLFKIYEKFLNLKLSEQNHLFYLFATKHFLIYSSNKPL